MMMTLQLNLPTHAGVPLSYGQLIGAGLSFALAEMLPTHTASQLIICPDTLSARRVRDELSFFLSDTSVRLFDFPDWETLPYDNFSPHQDIISDRIATLSALLSGERFTLIVPMGTLMHMIAGIDFIQRSAFYFKKGDILSLEKTRMTLEKRGYRCVNKVYEHGEFAVRGSIIDLFPMGGDHAYRMDLFDNQIDSIRLFDPETQRSAQQIAEINLLPALEFPFDEEAIRLFRQNWRDLFEGNPLHCPVYQNTSNGLLTGGIEYYLPLFYQKAGTLFDYLPEDCLIIRVGDLVAAAEQMWESVQQRYQQINIDRTRPCMPPQSLFLKPDQILAALKHFKQIQVSHQPLVGTKGFVKDFSLLPMPNLQMNHQLRDPLLQLKQYLAETSERILFCVESSGRREALLERLKTIDIHPHTVPSWAAFINSAERHMIVVGTLDQGLSLPEQGWACITESQLFGAQVLQRRRQVKRQDPEQSVRNLAELSIDSPIVHLEHGVGRYRGLNVIKTSTSENEYLTIEYAGGDKLYVPVTALHLVSRYSGFDPDQAPLHRLGSAQWDKAKQKAAEQVRDVAAELLDLYAQREARIGFQFDSPNEDYQAFSSGFPFEETPDQALAIEAVINDMQSERPMDRLVCGDVGFGKTEVAMRAAFMAVQSSKQVIVLVPTTLLAQQHYDNFKDRFADWPVNIEVLSRFQSAKQSLHIKEKIQSGQADIVIGTHKLLQAEFQIPRLGLVIIDEEHRFGVHQKEKLKALRTEVDILTLTATPIPRTLNMAVAGLRELSIIATPPARRLSVKTFVHERSEFLMREAILREVLRGGQVYFLHNSVDTIDQVCDEIIRLVPEAKASIAHGQMKERELERVMSDFYHQRFSVLVCTTIIETGIDIPTANTILIDRADKFGLAQLHQLRGRVGRSHHQAYAYLMTPPEKNLTSDAKKRLDVISAYDDLGVGFMLATHDLEIRGAGELLGDSQSGEIQAIGFSLYMELLEKTVATLKKGQHPDSTTVRLEGIEVDLGLPAFIPNDYLSDVHERLVLYKRIASVKDQRELDELKVELVDRFGLLPPACVHLIETTAIKLIAESIGIKKLEAHALGGRIEFYAHTVIEPMVIIELIQKKPQTYQLEGANRLRFKLGSDTPDKRIKVVKSILGALRLSGPLLSEMH